MTPGGRIRRFFDSVTVERGREGWRILLDGGKAKTRGGASLFAPTRALADGIAGEWKTGGEWIDTTKTPLTRLAWAAIDCGPDESGRWRALVQNYLGSDLVCYRAPGPAMLVARQATAWDPFLDWARDAFGADLAVTSGVARIEQPLPAVETIAGALREKDAWRLAGLKSACEITGSAILSLALESGAFPADRIFSASRLDERFQQERWGVDAEAAAREDALLEDFKAVDRWFRLLEA